MNLGHRTGDLKEVLYAIEDAFTALKSDFYIIGALARDIWYGAQKKSTRATKDVDFAVLVSSKSEYEAICNYLVREHSYTESSENAYALISPDGIPVDILPFGAITEDDKIRIQGFTSIEGSGFEEVYQSGTEKVHLPTGQSFSIATLPSIILLKLIAFNDRPEHRHKDPRDIANIIFHYFDLETDLIIEHHNKLFYSHLESISLKDISAMVIGKEIYKLLKSNDRLKKRLTDILQQDIEKADHNYFVKEMAREVHEDTKVCVNWLRYILNFIKNENE